MYHTCELTRACTGVSSWHDSVLAKAAFHSAARDLWSVPVRVGCYLATRRTGQPRLTAQHAVVRSFMGIESLVANNLFQRLSLMFTQPRLYPPDHVIRHMRPLKVSRSGRAGLVAVCDSCVSVCRCTCTPPSSSAGSDCCGW